MSHHNTNAIMAAPSSYTHISKSHLPPSPPPSPPAHRRRHVRKRSDSFEKLANTPLPSPPSEAQEPLVDHNEEPLLVRVRFPPTPCQNLRQATKQTTDNPHPNPLHILHPLPNPRQHPRPPPTHIRTLFHFNTHISLSLVMAGHRTISSPRGFKVGTERQ